MDGLVGAFICISRQTTAVGRESSAQINTFDDVFLARVIQRRKSPLHRALDTRQALYFTAMAALAVLSDSPKFFDAAAMVA